MTIEHLNKIDESRHLLPDPGAEVVGELVTEIRTLRDVAQHYARHEALTTEQQAIAENALK